MMVKTGDPFVMYDKKSNLYYCYATSETMDKNKKTFYIYESKDGINFKYIDRAFDTKDENNWGKTWFWAPEVYYNENNGYYYMFYSACLKDNLVTKYFYDKDFEETCKIGVAVSKSPKGPFKNITAFPLDYYPYDKDYQDIEKVSNNVFSLHDDKLLLNAPKGIHFPIIDASLFFNEDKIYLFFSRCCYKNCLFDKEINEFVEESNIGYVELDNSFWYTDKLIMPQIKDNFKFFNENTKQREDKYVNVITYKNEPQNWENAHIYDFSKTNGKNKNRRWAEGSSTFKLNIKNNDIYAILYSCNFYQSPSYGVGIAFSDNPLSNYKKYANNPIICQNEKKKLYSTGHGSVVNINDKMYYYFHGRNSLKATRSMYRLELIINDINDVKVKDIIHCKLIK